MAIRGKIKVVRDMGNGYTGTVTDTANNVDYEFEQPLGAELGLVEKMIVRMEIITKGDGTKLAICIDPVDKAKIETLDYATNSGTLKNNLGTIINFSQNYIRELGLAVGDRVSYTLVQPSGISDGGTVVTDPSGGTSGGATASTAVGTAVCLQKTS